MRALTGKDEAAYRGVSASLLLHDGKDVACMIRDSWPGLAESTRLKLRRDGGDSGSRSSRRTI